MSLIYSCSTPLRNQDLAPDAERAGIPGFEDILEAAVAHLDGDPGASVIQLRRASVVGTTTVMIEVAELRAILANYDEWRRRHTPPGDRTVKSGSTVRYDCEDCNTEFEVTLEPKDKEGDGKPKKVTACPFCGSMSGVTTDEEEDE